MAIATATSTFFVPFRRTNLAFGALSSFVGDESNNSIRYLLNPENLRPSDWPLLLFGPTGTGKSELAFSIVNDLVGHSKTKPLFLSAAEFARSFRTAIETNSTNEFRSKYARTSGLVLDQIDDLERFPKAQLEFISLIDKLCLRSVPMVMTASDVFPMSEKLLPQLMSRLSAGLSLPVNPPGKEALRVVIQQLSSIHSVQLTDDAVDFLLNRLSVTVPKINQFFIQFASSHNTMSEIDSTILSSYFDKLIKSDATRLAQQIIASVAKEFNVSVSDIAGSSRKQTTALARSVAVYFLRSLLSLSFSKIGSYLGNRDHSTIMHADKKIQKFLNNNNQSDAVFVQISKLELKLNEVVTANIS